MTLFFKKAKVKKSVLGQNVADVKEETKKNLSGEIVIFVI